MAFLNILQYPDLRLKKIASPVLEITEATKQLCADMLETLYKTKGVGLAATQVNVALRVMIIDISEEQDQPNIFINPEILAKRELIEWEEGCLSFPGVYAKVKRAKEIDVSYVDMQGASQNLTANGLMSICIQHEIDHLNGITFYDHLSPIKKSLLRNKLAKVKRKVHES